MKRIKPQTHSATLPRSLLFALAASASAFVMGCSHMGSRAGMDHGAMSSGTSGGAMGMMKPGADCPMAAEQRKMMCEGKSDDECKRAMDEHRQAMEQRMKEHMKGGGMQSSSAAGDMCDMGMMGKMGKQ